MKILFLTQLCPYPPSNGSAIKTYNALKYLGTRHDIRLLTFIRHEREVDFLPRLASFCSEVDFCLLKRSPILNFRQAAESLVSRESFIISRDRHPQMQGKVQVALANTPDVIYVDHLQMSQYVPKPPPCPVVLDDHNVEWRIVERFAKAGGCRFNPGRAFASIEWRKLRAHELSACREADLVIAVSPEDRDVLVKNGIPTSRIVPLPVGVDTERFRPVALAPDDRKVLTFGTLSWPPNADAALYFASSIYPLVKREIPDVRFDIVGANPPPAVRALADRDPSVRVTGFVDDLQEASRGTAAFVVPLRVGSGMRVKIIDAMAMGLPVVTTSVGCEGIPLKSGEQALVADAPGEFARAVVRLIREPEERVRLSSAGRRLVEEEYAWAPILSRLEEAICSLVQR